VSGIRPFDPGRDLVGVLRLVSESRARGDPGAIFHPGGLQWWLRRVGRPRFDVGVRSDGGRVVAFALHDDGDVLVQADPEHEKARAELLEWVETRARSWGEREIFVSIAESDEDLRRTVELRGYEPSERYGHELVCELDAGPLGPDLPLGFTMTSLTPDLTDAYVELHRAAWARPGSPSTYDRRQHDLVTAMPDFRYDLVPIVATSGGELAAYCMSWWDPRSGAVEIEPLGTHPAFRRKHLGRAIVREVIRRSSALGAKYVLVWGASGNAPAMGLYLSAGMHQRRVLRDYWIATASQTAPKPVLP
jgi:GNAT superfamily N-acetyltransferase